MIRLIKAFVFSILVATFLAGAGNSQAQLPPTGLPQDNSAQEFQAKAGAQAAATAWLALIDAGQYAESWQAAAGYFHTAITQDGWVTLLKGGFPVFGKVVSRNLKGIAYTRILPGAPNGEYVVLQYQTDFSNTKGLTEMVATVREPSGTWKVTGYHIK